jgi:hypothetical protein
MRRTAVVGLLAGLISAAFALIGDAIGGAMHNLASAHIEPYALIVVIVGITAPSLVHAVLRATLSQAVMVTIYYWHRHGLFTLDPTMVDWGLVALVGVPPVAALAYGGKAAFRGVHESRPSRIKRLTRPKSVVGKRG